MEVKIIEKKSFTVIGKLGQGLAKEGPKWIPQLWQEANSNFNEINNLAKLDSTGSIVGIWGIMSDVEENFEGWKEEGKYLAGCEVKDFAEAPNNWRKWVIPSYKYVVAKCTQDTYQDIFKYMMNEYLPQHEFNIVGAVHEFYNPNDTNGELSLYFPIQKI
ncbi:GyrI-like domain-containing protein [Chengkuizengella axinellae]|uniref:GyrI-like domain-containing protein n=1 Tax=Chengkuizengella axinellae TaxID=3064388 RepID=A0ABT9J6X6_9BACL|nr:GyrI-like domain-containing protein [Chengkuizengella sp. 2205SS18-9]MDP5276719.1 GyrI-like domain-containing protein [Chengkuizengella sp. 2205SS18-9]